MSESDGNPRQERAQFHYPKKSSSGFLFLGFIFLLVCLVFSSANVHADTFDLTISNVDALPDGLPYLTVSGTYSGGILHMVIDLAFRTF